MSMCGVSVLPSRGVIEWSASFRDARQQSDRRAFRDGAPRSPCLIWSALSRLSVEQIWAAGGTDVHARSSGTWRSDQIDDASEAKRRRHFGELNIVGAADNDNLGVTSCARCVDAVSEKAPPILSDDLIDHGGWPARVVDRRRRCGSGSPFATNWPTSTVSLPIRFTVLALGRRTIPRLA
jgi:hypothetical protein